MLEQKGALTYTYLSTLSLSHIHEHTHTHSHNTSKQSLHNIDWLDAIYHEPR